MARKYKSFRKKIGKKRRWTRRKKTSKGLKRTIQKVVNRNIEKKCIQQMIINRQTWFPAAGANYDAQNTLLLGTQPGSLIIQQGITQGTRIGNRCKVTNLTFAGTLFPNGYDAIVNPTPEPVNVRMILFYDKTNPTTVPAPRGDLFQFGGTTQAIQGNLMDMTLPVNTDKYRVLAQKKFKLGFAMYSGTGGPAGTQWFSNNEYKMNCNFRWNITKYHYKMLRFNDNTTVPSNRYLFCQLMYSPVTGNTGAAGITPVKINYTQSITYQDA